MYFVNTFSNSWGDFRGTRLVRGAIPSVSRFGQPRRLYFIDFPLILLSAGLLGWIFPTDRMLALTSAVGMLVGGYFLWDMVIRGGPLRFSYLFGVADLLGYGFGALNSWVQIDRGNMTLAEYFGKDTEAVTQAMGAVLLASAVVLVLGELYEKPIFPENFTLVFDNKLSLFIWLGTGLMLVGYLTGAMNYMGAQANGANVNLLGSLLVWLFPPLFAVTVVSFLNWPHKSGKWLLGVLIPLQFVMIIPTGRREILYTVLLSGFGFRFGEYRPRWSFTRKMVYTGFAIAILAASTTFFYYLRRAATGSSHRTPSITERIELAIDLYESGKSETVNQDIASNLKKRTFVLGFLADLLDASFKKPPAFGTDALHEFQLTIPSAIWEGKSGVLYEEESIANEQFDFSFGDEANSIFTAGALDFGIWGIFLYPLILWFVYKTFSRVLLSHNLKMTVAFASLMLIFDSLNTEQPVHGHILALRSAIIFSVLMWLYGRLPRFALRQHEPQGTIYG